VGDEERATRKQSQEIEHGERRHGAGVPQAPRPSASVKAAGGGNFRPY